MLFQDLVECIPVRAAANTPVADGAATGGCAEGVSVVVDSARYDVYIFCLIIEYKIVVGDVVDVCCFVLVIVLATLFHFHHISATAYPLTVGAESGAVNEVDTFNARSEFFVVFGEAYGFVSLFFYVVDIVEHIAQIAIRHTTQDIFSVGCDLVKPVLVLSLARHVILGYSRGFYQLVVCQIPQCGKRRETIGIDRLTSYGVFAIGGYGTNIAKIFNLFTGKLCPFTGRF